MDAKKLSWNEINESNMSHDVLYETKCRYNQAWLINDEYLKRLNGCDEAHLENVDLARRLMELDFPGLTKRQKQIVKYFITGHTQKEIANILSVTQQSVSQSFNAGLKKIKKNFLELKEK